MPVKNSKKDTNFNKGFTLIEIIVVLIIVGVLAALSVQSYFGWIEKARAMEAVLYLKTANDQIQACMANYKGTGFRPEDPLPEPCYSLSQSVGINPPLVHFVQGTIWSSSGEEYFISLIRNNVDYSGPIPSGRMPICAGIIAMGASPSGLGICHSLNGSNVVSGWGLYKGMY